MELLNGKAKEDFLKWCENDDNGIFSDESMNYANLALIIHWFDSVGIIILPQHGFKGYYNEIKNYNDKSFGEFKTYLICGFEDNYKTRNEAVEKAIEKANEIYNQL